jgi:drug/metabolite transporter (DMT)-like permease
VNDVLVMAIAFALGAAITLIVSRLLRLHTPASSFFLTVFGTTAAASAATVVAYRAFTHWDCPPDWLCDYPGMFGAGLAFGAVWFACYGVAYTAVAFLIARSQARSRATAGAMTPNTSLERTRDR